MRIAITEMSNEALLRGLIDALPAYVFLVDEDVSILDYNAAAATLLGSDRKRVLRHRGGDALHCIHATDSPDGCGRGPFCESCLVRQSVKEAFTGSRVVRRRVQMELTSAGEVNPLNVLLTASPFDYRGHRHVVLVLEDVSS
ncbi:MAG TPA: PAS domain-containing protein [Clostridia bacterium]|nr:PAS domain-containing protein [Clostridia bacterium]